MGDFGKRGLWGRARSPDTAGCSAKAALCQQVPTDSVEGEGGRTGVGVTPLPCWFLESSDSRVLLRHLGYKISLDSLPR